MTPRSQTANSAGAAHPVPNREHLFISYAWEDRAFADWLYARLTAEGYRVWMDRKKLQGGERWTTEIDTAIKELSFRMLAVLSRHSLKKPNPSKERTIALSLGNSRHENFLIPLNVGGVSDAELDWLTIDVTYIPFQNWAAGFHQLLKRLESVPAPRPLRAEGRNLAIQRFLPSDDVILQREDRLYTNCFRFSAIPDSFRVARRLAADSCKDRDSGPPHYRIGDTHVACFELGDTAQDGSLEDAVEVNWRDTQSTYGILPSNIVSSLLRQTLEREWLKRGLVRDPESGLIYFPAGLTPNDKIRYSTADGRTIPVNAVGVRKLRGEKTRYHLAPSFRIRQDMGTEFVAQLKLKVFLTDPEGKRLEPSKAFSRRKALTSNWFNHQWLTKYLAVAEFFAQSRPVIDLCTDTTLRLEAVPMNGSIPLRINDRALEPFRDDVNPIYEEDYEEDSDQEP
jgi:hypothetical protein